MNETALPRTLAVILLVVSISMFVPLGLAVAAMLRGEPVATLRWSVPLVVLATGTILIHLLARRGIAQRMFLPAMALWLLASGYFLFVIR